MNKAVEHLQHELANIRTGRATPGKNKRSQQGWAGRLVLAQHEHINHRMPHCMLPGCTAAVEAEQLPLGVGAGMLDHLKVDVYGERMPLKACGTVLVRDPQLLAISVFDPSVRNPSVLPWVYHPALPALARLQSLRCRSMFLQALSVAITCLKALSWCLPASPCPAVQTMDAIQKAIRESPLQLNPKAEGQEILVPIPR